MKPWEKGKGAKGQRGHDDELRLAQVVRSGGGKGSGVKGGRGGSLEQVVRLTVMYFEDFPRMRENQSSHLRCTVLMYLPFVVCGDDDDDAFIGVKIQNFGPLPCKYIMKGSVCEREKRREPSVREGGRDHLVDMGCVA